MLSLPSLTIEQLADFAEKLSSLLNHTDIILLKGDLGAGKTTFVQLLAKALEVDDEEYVSSPSFALLHEYTGRIPLFHMDLYRLSGEDDVEAAGLLDYFHENGLCLVEWPDRLEEAVPDNYLEIEMKISGPEQRDLFLFCHGEKWQKRRPELQSFCEHIR